MATTVNIHEAKTQLSKLIERAENGEDVVIARAGKPAVRLIPVEVAASKRQFGSLKHLGWKIPDDIDTPFEKEIHEMFYGNPDKFSR